MRKIAPQLDALLEFDLCVKGSGGLKTDICKKELRALLAVARAARWWVDADMKFEKGTPANALHAAMARLDRVSKGEP